MNKKYFIYLFFLLLVVVTGGLYLFNTKTVRQGNMWQMLPNTPALVLQTDNAGEFMDKIGQNNEIWDALIRTKGFKPVYRQLTFVDSVFSNQKQWKEAFRQGELFAAVYPGNNQFLFLLQNKKLPRIEKIKSYLETTLGAGYVVIYKHRGNFPVTVIKIFNIANNKSYWLWKMDGVLLFTTQEQLMEASLSGYTMQEMHFSDSDGFKKVKATSGKLVDARLFVYYPVLGKLFSNFFNIQFKNTAQNISRFAEWSETDLMINSQDIVFSGYTVAGKGSTLSRFKNQQPVSLNAFTLFPFNSTFSLSKGFSGYSSYTRKNISSSFKTVFRTAIRNFAKLTGKDVSLVSNSLDSNELSQKSWAIVQVNDMPGAARVLKDLALKSGNHKLYHFGNYTIRQINIPHLLSGLYGESFSIITQNYYCFINNFVVFANSSRALLNLIHFSETGKTLDLDENYKSFSNNLAGTSNLIMHIRPRTMMGLLTYFLNKKTAVSLTGYLPFLRNIQGVAFQYSHDASLYYTNFYIRYNKAFKNENLALWKVKLNHAVAGKPFLVKDHESKKYDIIVFDKGNRMYLLDNTGKILWTRQLTQLPLSPIYPVDYYKNGKIQYLFNTENNLFLLDRKGRYVANYPIAIHPSATNGLSLFDYTRHKDYRILVAQADKRIYDYTLKGNQVSGWRKPQMQALVSQKVVRLLAGRKDYIIINDNANHVRIVNRRGQQRIYLKSAVDKARHSGYFVNKTNNKGIILTTNTSGKLVYIAKNGKLQFTDFGKFSPNHYFLYDDFNGDGFKDFIFVDHNKLQVFDRFKKRLFSYTFSEDVTIQPKFFSLGDRQKVLGIVASKEKTIYLFDSKGNILISRGLTGETPFTVGSLNNNREVNIITATGSTLYNYRIK